MGNTPTTPGQPAPLADGEFRSLSQRPAVTWLLQETQPPPSVYVSRDDQLVAQLTSASLNETATISLRALTIDGKEVQIQSVVRAGNAFTTTTALLTGFEGFVLGITALGGLAQQRGISFLRVWLNRGGVALAGAFEVLLSDYVNSFEPISWPYGQLSDPRDRSGSIGLNLVGNPGAGVDWSSSLGNTQMAQVYGASARLVTSATVANRYPTIQLADGGGNVYYRSAVPAAIAAGTTINISFTLGMAQAQGNAAQILVPLPTPCVLVPGGTISVVTANLQAGDQWSQIAIAWEQWLTLI